MVSFRLRRALLGPLALLPFVGLVPQALAQCELARLVANDAVEGDQLGTRAAISGDWAFVAAMDHDAQGTSSGAVYVAQRTATGWSLVDKLMASDGSTGTRFGSGIAIEGARALIGSARGAYAFELTPSGWVEVQKVVASDMVDGDGFGRRIALRGDRALISAPAKDTPAGEEIGVVYVFERDASGWVEVDRLHSPDGRPEDYFGEVALGEDVAIVGAPGHDLQGFASKGAVYVFERDATGWDEGTKFSVYAGDDFDRFGTRLSIHRDRFIAAAPGEDSIEFGRGAVYVFRRLPSGWTQEARLIPDGPVAHGYAEHGIAISGDKVLVAGYLSGDSGVQAGRVFVYKRTDLGWLFEYRFAGSAAEQGSTFGTALAVDGDTVVVGARGNGDICNPHSCSSGAAYVFSASVGSASNFCVSEANSTGAPAVISMTGCTDVARNELGLVARPVPEGRSGIFFYGDRQLSATPFGDGYRCVGGRVYRLPLTHAAGEELTWDLDLTAPPQTAGQITAGSTWFFQAYYRDPAAGGAGFNASDALEVLFPN